MQALAVPSDDSDADPHDIYLTDSKGYHTGWVLLAARFETITGLPRGFCHTGLQMTVTDLDDVSAYVGFC